MNEKPACGRPWKPVTSAAFAWFSGGLVLFVLLMLVSEPGFVPLLDHANLAFHEAGHLFVGILSSQLEVYGGTIGQCVFPVVLIIGFWRQRAPLSFAAGWLWLFENFFNIARYMADARALDLPLVGGGGHDWNEIFYSWSVLQHDTTIARAVIIAGWLGIAATWCWAGWRALRSRTETKSSE